MAIPKFLKKWTKKKIIWTAVILLILAGLGWLIFGRGKNTNSLQTAKVQKQDLELTVLATGQVASSTSLELSFQGSGIVRRVYVKEGDKVAQGQTLAVLDQSAASANLKVAEGSLAQAKANYEKILAGSTAEDIKVLEDAVASAQQDLDNAYSDGLSYLDDAYIKIYNAYTTANSLVNDYFYASDQQGLMAQESKNKIYSASQAVKDTDTDSVLVKAVNDLNEVSSALKVLRDLCDQGIYYSKVSATDKTGIDTQRGYINTAMTNIANSQQSVASDKIALQKAKSQLALKKAPARQEDIALYEAQITSAKGQYESALSALNNTVLSSPVAGTITKVDTKIGQLATSAVKIIDLQDTENLYAESDISEASIALLKTGQEIDYTFDALGPDKHFLGKIITINPASTVISGVVNYKIKSSLENVPDVKPGMTVNMIIKVANKQGVLAVSSSAVINKNNKKYVRLVTDTKTKTYSETEVQTGLQADGGLVEILSGLAEGQEIVTFIKQ